MVRRLLIGLVVFTGCAQSTTAPVAPQTAAESPPASEEPPLEQKEVGIIGMMKAQNVLEGEASVSLSWDYTVSFALPEGVRLRKHDDLPFYRWNDPSGQALLVMARFPVGAEPLSVAAEEMIENLGLELVEPAREGLAIVCEDDTHGRVWSARNEQGVAAVIGFQRRDDAAVVFMAGAHGSDTAPGGELYEAVQRTMRIETLDGKTITPEPCGPAAGS